MKHLKTFESYNNELINENLFSYLFNNLSNNNDIKKGMEMINDFFNKNPKELEALKRDTAVELSKFNEEEIEEFKNKLTKFKEPVQDEKLKDAAEKVISELNESTVVSNAIKYLAHKLLDFIGVTSKWLGVMSIIGQAIIGGGLLAEGITLNPLKLLGFLIGGILLIIAGSVITNYTKGKYDSRANTKSPGSLDQFSGEHTMRYN